MTEWLDLGYGIETEILWRLPAGTWTVIRDDDDAAGVPRWRATQTKRTIAEAEHEARGGTVSASFVFIRSAT